MLLPHGSCPLAELGLFLIMTAFFRRRSFPEMQNDGKAQKKRGCESSRPRFLGQHRTIWQEHSAKDFASYESYKRAGILYVFPPFITARMRQKIGRRPQTQLCGDA